MILLTNSLIDVQTNLPYKLPVQVLTHFKDSSPEELLLIYNLYSGKNPNPTFEEWLESYQHNTFFNKSLSLSKRASKIKTEYSSQSSLIDSLRNDPSSSESDLKNALLELKRLASLMGHNEDAWMNTNKELNKLLQETLKREKPRDINVRHTMSIDDINNILQSEKDAIDVEWTDIED